MKNISFDELESRLQRLASPGIRPGLARLSSLLSAAGNPERSFKAVHIVGTNGKGSTAATLESILRASGYRTALYTSPHLVSFGERLSVCGIEAPASEWMSQTERVAAIIGKSAFLSKDRPTYFELITAIAFMIIAARGVDIAVIEAGLGGRLDASNMLKDVALSVIVPLGMDHMDFLGDTIEKIAAEKFAIMRPGVPAIFFGGQPSVEKEFVDRAKLVKAPCRILTHTCDWKCERVTFDGTDFSITNNGKRTEFHTPLIGPHQADNAVMAINSADELKERGFDRVLPESIKRGVESVVWQGRFEVIKRAPILMVDGAHNSHAMKRLVETLTDLGLDGKIHLVMAMMHDKDIKESFEILKSAAPLLYCSDVPGMGRSMTADGLCRLAEQTGIKTAGAWNDPFEAIAEASKGGSPVLCCGSLYFIGWLKVHRHEI